MKNSKPYETFLSIKPYVVDTARQMIGGSTTSSGITLSDVTAAIAAHVAEADPHTIYMTTTEGDARYYSKVDSDARYVLSSRQITGAGALGGGGYLNADRTITMNTPGGLSVSTTNSSTTNHTHAITASSDVSAGTSSLLKSASGALALSSLTTSGAITATGVISGAADTDSTHIFGRAKIHSAASDSAMFSHYDHNTSTNYGFRQTSAGQSVINSASGQSTLFRIANTSIMSMSSSGLVFEADKYLALTGYVSGWAGNGWRLDDNLSTPGESFFEIDNMSIRGTLSVYELLINQIRATNGSLFVASAGKIESMSGSDWTLEDPEGNGYCGFATNDLVIIQDVDLNGSTIVKRIVRRVTAVTGNVITVTAASGGPTDVGSPTKGNTVVRFGNSTNVARQGTILLTSDMSNSPYEDIISGVTSWSDWTGGTKTKMRIGLLSGLSIGSAYEYGFAAGDGFATTDSYIKASTSGTIQNNTISTWRESGTTFLSISATDGIEITIPADVSEGKRAYTFATTGGTEFGGMYAFNISGTNANYLYIQGAQSGKNTYVTSLAQASSASYSAESRLQADNVTYSAEVRVRADSLGAVELSGDNYVEVIAPYFLYTDGANDGLKITDAWTGFPGAGYGAEISNDSGSYQALMIAGNKSFNGSTRRVSIYDDLYVASRTGVGVQPLSLTDNVSNFVSQVNTTASGISLSNTSWGYSSMIGFSAYHADNTISALASGGMKYFGSQYTGNITAPGMIHWDGNGNLFTFAIGPTGLANGADITSWSTPLKIYSDHISVLENTDAYSYIGRAVIGSMGLSDYAGFSHYDYANSTSYALLQNSSGITLLNATTGTSIRYRIGNAGVMYMSSTGLKIGAESSPSATLDVAGTALISSTLGVTGTTTAATINASGRITGSAGGDTIRIVGSGTTGASSGFLSVYDVNGTTRRGYFGLASTGNTDIYARSETGALRLGDSTGSATLLLSGGDATFTGVIASAADTDVASSFGRAKVGYMSYADHAGFSHYDMASAGNYALLQSSVGVTYLNAASGQAMKFRINNSGKGWWDTTGLHVGSESAPSNVLQVTGNAYINQSSTTAAIPVIKLTQADTDVAFIEFNGSVGTLLSVDTAGLGSYSRRLKITVNGTTLYLAAYSG